MRSVLKAQGFSLDVPELKRAAVLNAVKVKGAAAGRGHSSDSLGVQSSSDSCRALGTSSEWDDENKKNGNVQHLREHGVFFFTTMISVMTSGLMTFIFWMVAQIAADACDLFSRIKDFGSLAFLRVGSSNPKRREKDEEAIWQVA